MPQRAKSTKDATGLAKIGTEVSLRASCGYWPVTANRSEIDRLQRDENMFRCRRKSYLANEAEKMGHDVSWQFKVSDISLVQSLLSSAPRFKQLNAPYFEYFASSNGSTHPDAIAAVTLAGLDFTSFGDPAVISEVQEYLRPRVTAQFGDIVEKF